MKKKIWILSTIAFILITMGCIRSLYTHQFIYFNNSWAIKEAGKVDLFGHIINWKIATIPNVNEAISFYKDKGYVFTENNDKGAYFGEKRQLGWYKKSQITIYDALGSRLEGAASGNLYLIKSELDEPPHEPFIITQASYKQIKIRGFIFIR